MPGANCSIESCHTSRRQKYKGISIFKIPSATNDSKAEWREKLINVITLDRTVDASLRKQIEDDNLHICERHFAEDQLWVYGNKKSMKDNVIPSLNLPVKSIVTPSLPPRSFEVIEKREIFMSNNESVDQISQSLCYTSFTEFKNRISKLKLSSFSYPSWFISYSDSLVTITCPSTDTLLPRFEIFVEPSLRFTLRMFGWMLLSTERS